MEHIVQFAISIDDKTICQRIELNAEKEITQKLFEEVRRVLFERYQDNPTYYFESKMDEFFKDSRDEIIDTAGKYLAEKLSRTKRGKEILDKYESSEENENDT
ncbi:MAG: hypothetical protein K2H01_04800 [Ruminococcus sp.]|nr:hypothetical protein [Ruminococcus sp.]